MAATAQTQPALFHLQQSFESIRSRQPVTKLFGGYHTLTLSQNVARVQLHSAIPKRLRRKDGVLIFRSKEQCDISTPQPQKTTPPHPSRTTQSRTKHSSPQHPKPPASPPANVHAPPQLHAGAWHPKLLLNTTNGPQIALYSDSRQAHLSISERLLPSGNRLAKSLQTLPSRPKSHFSTGDTICHIDCTFLPLSHQHSHPTPRSAPA